MAAENGNSMEYHPQVTVAGKMMMIKRWGIFGAPKFRTNQVS